MKELTLRVVEGVGRQARLDRPTFDPELRAGLAIVGGMFPPTVTSDLIDFMRVSYAGPPLETLIGGRNIRCEERVFEGYEGHPLKASVFRHERASGQRPGVLFVHSGGLMFGDRFSGLDRMIDFVEQLGVVLVSIEYRLAPEYRDPYPREDVYAALEWMALHAESLGVRLDRLLIAGASAGGGLAAGAALAARDRGGPRLCGQLLDYPMLDDRGITKSTLQFDGIGVWDRVSNETGSGARCLAKRAVVRMCRRMPRQLVQLSFATCRPRFSTSVAPRYFATKPWPMRTPCGMPAGRPSFTCGRVGFHAFDIFAPHTALSRGMIATRSAWMSRVLGD